MLEQMDRKNVLAMKLLHYFITEKNYNPIILQGAEDEIWLENLNSDYKIVRIVSNHIINEEQFNFDIFKTKHVVKKIKRKTFSFSMNVLSIFTDLEADVNLKENKNIDCVSLNEIEDLSKYDFVKEVFPDICNKMEFTEEGFQLFMKITADINRKNKAESVKVDEVFKPKIPFITYGLIVINTIVFILMRFFGYGDYIIGKYSTFGASIVIDQEFFRLITGAFVHLSIMHFIFNMYSLLVIGAQMESYLGKIKYFVVLLFSTIIGSLFSLIFNSNNVTFGMSGVIFGIIGSMLYFGYHYRVYLGQVIKSQIIPIAVGLFLLGLFSEGEIDNFANIGGLIAGALITMALGVKYKSTSFEKTNGLIVSILLTGFLIFVAFNYVNFS